MAIAMQFRPAGFVFPDVLRSLACANRFSTLLFRFLLIPKEIKNRVVKIIWLESDAKSPNAVEQQGFQHRNADWNDRLQMHQGKPEEEFDFRTRRQLYRFVD
jgi:hypothetical protein